MLLLIKLILINFVIFIKILILFRVSLLMIIYLSIRISVWSLVLFSHIWTRIFAFAIRFSLVGGILRSFIKLKKGWYLNTPILIRSEKYYGNQPSEERRLRYDLTFINCTFYIFFISFYLYFSFYLSLSFYFWFYLSPTLSFLVWNAFYCLYAFSNFYISPR